MITLTIKRAILNGNLAELELL